MRQVVADQPEGRLCSLLQMTNTDVAFPPYCRSCPYDRHDLSLPSIPASLQTLGRCECAAACAFAPHGLRIISPLTFYLSFLRAIWTFYKKLALIFPSHLSTVRPQIFPDSRPHPHHIYMSIPSHIYIYMYTYIYKYIYIPLLCPRVCQTLGSFPISEFARL